MTSVETNNPIRFQIGRFQISEVFTSASHADSEGSEDSSNLGIGGRI